MTSNRRTVVRVGLALGLAALPLSGPRAQEPARTATEWRDDDKNAVVVRELNPAYRHLVFSRDYEGVLDHPPLRLDWEIGPNLPVAWKGGATALFGDTVVIAGGLWMPGRKNLVYQPVVELHGAARTGSGWAQPK